MKSSMTIRSNSELKLISTFGPSDLELNPMICHTRKLTHWPSRYKQGIQMTKLRKKTEKNIKSNPICLSFCKTHNFLAKKTLKPSQNFKPNGYAKRLNMNYYLTNSLDSSLWKAPEVPKIKFQIKGKALNINEMQGDMGSNKNIRNAFKDNCGRNGSAWLGKNINNSSMNVSPW